MSLLPDVDEELITNGWQRVQTGELIKSHYQFFSFGEKQWIQCSKYSPKQVAYSSLYRRPIAFWPWIQVYWGMFKFLFEKKPILKK